MDFLQLSLQECYTEAAGSSQTMENNNYITWRHESPPSEFKAHKMMNTDFPLGKIWKVSDRYLAVQNTSKWGKAIDFLFDGRRSGLDSWQVQYKRFVCPLPSRDRVWGPTSLLPNAWRSSFSWVRWLRMKLTTHFHLEARFKTRRGIPPVHYTPSWRIC